ncbi:MAG: NlpC/P60 family protein [Ignavibacteriaceae bacterium]
MSCKIIVPFLITAGILLMTGCSSISQSTRYSKNTKQEKEYAENLRFNHEQDSIRNIPANDSLLVNESEDELEDYDADSSRINSKEILKKFTLNEDAIDNDFGTSKEKMLMEIIRWLNTPYKYGGNTKNGIDCSAFTQTVFKSSLNFSLLRSAREQFTQGEDIDNTEDLKFGDLVFFNTRRRVRPGHVGIYLGNNIFAHSSTKLGVVVSSLEGGYYNQRFMGGRRIEDFVQSSK